MEFETFNQALKELKDELEKFKLTQDALIEKMKELVKQYENE